MTAEAVKKVTKRVVDAAIHGHQRYIIWDSELKGFGLRVETSGTKSYFVRYRPRDGGARGPKRFLTIGRHGRPFGAEGTGLTPEAARREARRIIGLVADGRDPANERSTAKARPTLKVVLDDFMSLHVRPKLKPNTEAAYRSIFDLYIIPKWGKRRAEDISQADLVRMHANLRDSKATANRVLNYLSAAYSWAAENGYVAAGYNPTRDIDRFAESKRERFLTVSELDRLGAAIREAETVGVPWEVNKDRPSAKHLPKADKRHTPISSEAAAAIRLLLFTGARLREILHLKWEYVDFERAALFLPDSKTGKKTIYLNAPALSVLKAISKVGTYVFPGEPRSSSNREARKFGDQPRHDLKRPWEAVRRLADLKGVRLHDLRHTHASFGVGGGLGLPIIAKLLGHAQIRTTERYSHLDADPIRFASEAIGKRIADAMGEKSDAIESEKARLLPRTAESR